MFNVDKTKYEQMVNQIKPKPTIGKNVFWAFIVGGSICTIGQFLFNLFSNVGLEQLDARAATSAILVFATAVLTGIGWFDTIAKFAGAGTIVPITGFANSMVSPALEFKREGFVFGTAAKLFSVAGPVIVSGIFISWIIGLFYFVFKI